MIVESFHVKAVTAALLQRLNFSITFLNFTVGHTSVMYVACFFGKRAVCVVITALHIRVQHFCLKFCRRRKVEMKPKCVLAPLMTNSLQELALMEAS
jgi:hypothetical protein